MQLERLKHLPAPDGDLLDWTIYSQCEAESRMNLLVYATKRDFLSAPPCHVLVSLKAYSADIVVEESSIYQCFEDAESVPEDGIYALKGAEDKFFLAGESVLKINFRNAEVLDQVYHYSSSAKALENYLGTLI